jgi:hypothetical protein
MSFGIKSVFRNRDYVAQMQENEPVSKPKDEKDEKTPVNLSLTSRTQKNDILIKETKVPRTYSASHPIVHPMARGIEPRQKSMGAGGIKRTIQGSVDAY